MNIKLEYCEWGDSKIEAGTPIIYLKRFNPDIKENWNKTRITLSLPISHLCHSTIKEIYQTSSGFAWADPTFSFVLENGETIDAYGIIAIISGKPVTIGI